MVGFGRSSKQPKEPKVPQGGRPGAPQHFNAPGGSTAGGMGSALGTRPPQTKPLENVKVTKGIRGRASHSNALEHARS